MEKLNILIDHLDAILTFLVIASGILVKKWVVWKADIKIIKDNLEKPIGEIAADLKRDKEWVKNAVDKMKK